MDVSGARALRRRIAQQAHWRQAPAVRDGRQPGMDPDLDALRELDREERVYRDDSSSFVKRLVDGAWVRIEIGRELEQ